MPPKLSASRLPFPERGHHDNNTHPHSEQPATEMSEIGQSNFNRGYTQESSDTDNEDIDHDSTTDARFSPPPASCPSRDTQVATPGKRQKVPDTTTPRKHRKVQQEEGEEHAQEAVRGDDETPIDELLPYRSIKTIAVPPRPNSEQEPVKDDPSTYYGDMDYVDSMMTYWLDEVGYGYQKTAELCTDKIKKYTYEGVRKRHIAALQTHYRKYGLKPLADIPSPINEKAKNRGKPRALKKAVDKYVAESQGRTGTSKTSTIDSSDVQWTSGLHSSNEALPIYVREAPFRQIEATAIVVCRDLFKMEFSQIRDLMDKSYGFTESEKTIENYYQAARPSAWGSRYHGYTNIDKNLDQETLAEKKDSEAAFKASMPLAQDVADDANQSISQRRPPIKISQINKGDGVQLFVAPASPVKRKDAEAVITHDRDGIEFDDRTPDTTGRDSLDTPKDFHGGNGRSDYEQYSDC